jgi:adenylate cyclase
MSADEWSQLLQTDMDRLLTGQDQVKAERIKLKKGERRNVSVLFLDIKGFTAMSEKLDPEEVTQIIDNVFKVLTSEIIRYSGMVDKYIGDAIMALFGAKKASEDDAERAIRAALGMLDRMVQVNKILEPKDIELGCRIGINTGLVVAGELGGRGERDFTVMGDTVNTASRLETVAEVNTILISENTRVQAEDVFDYEALEPIKLKGKSKPLKVYRVHGVLKERVERWDRDTLAKSRAYVGREKEWGELKSFMKEYLESEPEARVPVVGLKADGGMGKSRLVHEFLNRGSCPQGPVLKGKTISFAAAPYWIFVSLIKNMMKASEGDPVETVREKWKKLFERLNEFSRLPEDNRESARQSLAEHEDYLAYLLGVAPEADRIKAVKPDKLKKIIFKAFHVFLEAASALPDEGDAVYLVFDDLHWVDELSRELIDYLMDNLKPECRMLFITMFRPDYKPSEHWRKGINYFELNLRPLSLEESTEMVQGMLKGLVLTDELKNLIYDKSGGNPFYIEEITFSLIDQEVLVQNDQIQPGNPIWIVNPSEKDVQLPDSIHGMVQTRIDKLDEKVRNLLFEASVIGMEFNVDLLGKLHAKAGGDRKDVKNLLEDLKQAQMIIPKLAEPAAQAAETYVFANVLIAEVSYNTLLNYNKTVLHGLVGDCIEEIYEGEKMPEDEHYRLAFHFEKGGKADKAISYLESAGDQCATRFSNNAAINCYSKLLAQLKNSKKSAEEISRIRLRNTFRLAEIEYLLGALDEAYRHYGECSKISQTLKDYEILCSVLTRAGEIDRIREKPEKAVRFFEKSLELAEKLELDYYAADNLANLGIVQEEGGDYSGAMEYFQKALARATTDEQRQNISHYIFQRS